MIKQIKYINIIFLLMILISCGGKNVEDLMSDAKSFIAIDDYRSASIELKSLLQKMPDNGEARFLLGSILLEMGEGVSAEKEMRLAGKYGWDEGVVQDRVEKALLLQEKYQVVVAKYNQKPINEVLSKQASVNLGEAYLSLGQIERAKKSFKLILGEDPDNREAQLGLAKSLYETESQVEAKKILENLLANSPSYVDALLYNGAVLQRENELKEALKQYQKVIKLIQKKTIVWRLNAANLKAAEVEIRLNNFESGARYIDHVLKVRSKHPYPNYLMGLLRYRQGLFEDARRYLEVSADTSPDNKQLLFLLGLVSYELNNYEQTILYLEKYLVGNPNNTFASKILGATLLRLDKPEEAIASLSPVIKSAADDGELLAMLGGAMVQVGNKTEGVKYLQKAVVSNPAEEGLKTELARVLFSMGETDDAILQLEALNDKSHQANSILVMSYVKNKQFKKAIKEADEVISRAPNDGFGYHLKGNIYLVMENEIEALKLFNKSVEVDPKHASSYIMLARLAIASGHNDKAESQLENASKILPKNLDILLALSELASKKGDEDRALIWLNRARKADVEDIRPLIALARYYFTKGEFKDAAKNLDEAQTIKADHAGVLLLSGLIARQSGDLTDALNDFKRLVQLHPKHAQGWYLKAQIYLAQKNARQAIDALTKVIEINPNHSVALKELVTLHVKDGAKHKAREIVAKITGAQPDGLLGHILEGDFHMAATNFKRAVLSYERAVRNSSAPAIIIRYYQALKASGEQDKAIKILRTYVEKLPDSFELKLALAEALVDIKEYDEAEQLYRPLLKSHGNNVRVLNNLAWLLVNKDPMQAVKLAEQAYQLMPTNPAIADTLGWVYVNNSQPDLGLKYLNEAYKVLGEVLEVKYHRAVAMAKIGEKEKAKVELQLLLERNVPFIGIERAKQIYSTL